MQQQPTSSAGRGTTLYTFGAVLLAILIIAALVVPAILQAAESIYLDLVDDVNERQARSMSSFVQNRLQAGLDEDDIVREFQAATFGSDVDRGYVCLIEREGVRYLSHPDPGQLGMDVKPGAVFDPSGELSSAPWSGFLERGDSAGGELSYGPQMAQESVFFTAVPGTTWTVSTHENLARIEDELQTLRGQLIAGSVFLSMLFALPASLAARIVHRRREDQIEREAELERRLLEEEDARKSQELEQARDLQLSLVPQSLSTEGSLEIAAHMETATEVGGDYYDVLESDDGSTLIAIGDATGHGLQSGMMVLAAKSLLSFAGRSTPLEELVTRMAASLRGMELGRLHLAFAVARLRGRTLESVGAGMPPALVHRKQTDSIEELALHGAPLGSPMKFPYQPNETELEEGDTVLFASDGLAELRLPSGELLGYDEVQRLFHDAARVSSADEVVAELRRAIEERRGAELDDDITLLVLRAG